MDLGEHARRSAEAAFYLTQHRWFRSARHIACYLPSDAELDPTAVMAKAWATGKTVYLPVLSIHHHNHLHFLPYAPGDALLPNRFGIPEPVSRGRGMVKLSRLDLVLTPLVGFDAQGNRLGMGGGFYDRSFAFLRRRQSWRKPRLLGLAFDLQKVNAQTDSQGAEGGLLRHAWDVPLDGVVTESGVKMVGRAG
jgi:5-formyltetrahydrofolate cyclo-ligase